MHELISLCFEMILQYDSEYQFCVFLRPYINCINMGLDKYIGRAWYSLQHTICIAIKVMYSVVAICFTLFQKLFIKEDNCSKQCCSYEAEFVIGDETDCDKKQEAYFCNGPLSPGTTFK